MLKTDKELTVEIVCTFISSWNAKNSTNAIDAKHVPDLITTVHKALSSLPSEKTSRPPSAPDA